VYRLVCLPMRVDQLQVLVEPVDEDVRRACQWAWDGLRNAMKKSRPKLRFAEICDSTSGRSIMRAQIGLMAELGRRETIQLVAVALITIIWVIIGANSFARHHLWELLDGGLPSLAGGFIAVVLAIATWRGGTIRWQD
jgi:hypothetical protein